MQKQMLIIKLGNTLESLMPSEGDFEDWTKQRTGLPEGNLLVCNAACGDVLPAPETLLGAIILGSHHNVTERLEWSEQTAAWIRAAHAAHLPMLGICYGHQLIAHALGGEVDFNPNGTEMGTVEISLNAQALENKLFADFPGDFAAHVCHSQCVLQLPPKAIHLARSAREANQSFYIHPHVWGVQFHPEFYEKVTSQYLAEFTEKLLGENQDVAALKSLVQPTPWSESVLARFAHICQQNAA